MWTEPLRSHVDGILAQTNSRSTITDRVGHLFREQGVDPTAETVSGVVAQLVRYVSGTPDLLQAAAFEAQNYGILPYVEPLLVQCAGYFLEESDLIPDVLGVYGLLDDAYLAQTFLAGISAAHAELTGIPLMGAQLTGANSMVRIVIGDPIASQLDRAVIQDLQNTEVRAQLDQLARDPRTMGVGATGEAGSWGGTWEDEMARSAAELGISLDL